MRSRMEEREKEQDDLAQEQATQDILPFAPGAPQEASTGPLDVVLPLDPKESMEAVMAAARQMSQVQAAEQTRFFHERAERSFEAGFDDVYKTGLWLIAAEELGLDGGHGDRENYYRMCGFEPRTAQRYKQFVRLWPEIKAKAVPGDGNAPLRNYKALLALDRDNEEDDTDPSQDDLDDTGDQSKAGDADGKEEEAPVPSAPRRGQTVQGKARRPAGAPIRQKFVEMPGFTAQVKTEAAHTKIEFQRLTKGGQVDRHDLIVTLQQQNARQLGKALLQSPVGDEEINSGRIKPSPKKPEAAPSANGKARREKRPEPPLKEDRNSPYAVIVAIGLRLEYLLDDFQFLGLARLQRKDFRSQVDGAIALLESIRGLLPNDK